MARNHSNKSPAYKLAKAMHDEEVKRGPRWNQLAPYGPDQMKWIEIAEGLLQLDPKVAFANEGSSMQDWRNQNPNPKHGCGHMQGRGAA